MGGHVSCTGVDMIVGMWATVQAAIRVDVKAAQW